MGCDIHLTVEQRDGSGAWQRVLPPESARDAWLVQQSAKNPTDEWYQRRAAETWYDGRNYRLFAMLADVRNGYGFAGCDTGDPLLPISVARGLPGDLGDDLRRIADGEGDENTFYLGDHSFSWLLVQELIDYDWSQVAVERGWVDPWNFELSRRQGKPLNYSGGISGPCIEHITSQMMAHLIDSGDIQFEGDDADWLKSTGYETRPYTTSLSRNMGGWGLRAGSVGAAMAAPKTRAEHYCVAEWTELYSEAAGEFYKMTLPALRDLGRPTETRLVFGFDS